LVLLVKGRGYTRDWISKSSQKRGNIHMKKIILALLLALQFTAATQVATATVEFPVCWPCDGK
jgi:hypothetical protein